MISGVIFDFDGVLADSFEAVYTMVKSAFAEIGVPIDEETYRQFYLTNVKEGERRLVQDPDRFQRLQELITAKFPQAYEPVGLFPFVPDLIRTLAASASLAIVSSTPKELIEKKLSQYELTNFFVEVAMAGTELTKKGKLESTFSALSPEKGQVMFVSDTVGDIVEGRELGLPTCAVTWGYNGRALLEGASPDVLVNSPEELITCIGSF